VSEEPNTPLHSVSVAAAVVDVDRVLVMRRRDNGRWEPPGGVLELAESIPDGLRREVREETGLIVEPDALTGVYKNLTRGVVALVFRCHATGGVLAATAEAGDSPRLHCAEPAACWRARLRRPADRCAGLSRHSSYPRPRRHARPRRPLTPAH